MVLTKIFPFCRLHKVSETMKLGKTENKKGHPKIPICSKTYRLTQSMMCLKPNTSTTIITLMWVLSIYLFSLFNKRRAFHPPRIAHEFQSSTIPLYQLLKASSTFKRHLIGTSERSIFPNLICVT